MMGSGPKRLCAVAVRVFSATLSLVVLSFALPSVSASTAATATVGMPFSGKWAYNVNVNPPYSDLDSSHPSVHAKYYGDWATDLYAGEGTPVHLQVKAAGTVTFGWLSYPNGTCGQRTVIAVYVNGSQVGSVYYEHLANAVRSGAAPANGMVVGYVHDWGGCNPGPHVHVELKSVSNNACWTDNGHPGTTLGEGDALGVLGSTNSGFQQPCGAGVGGDGATDSDGDGVPAPTDHCPTTPGRTGRQGCPALTSQLTVRPTRLRGDKDVLVSWTVRSPLADGWHYELAVIALKRGKNCTNLTQMASDAHPERGVLVHLRARSRAGDGHYGRWCAGMTEFTLYVAQDSKPHQALRLARSILRIYRR